MAEAKSSTFLTVSWFWLMSAIPRSQAFVDPAVRVFGRLLAGEFFLHARHPSTEGVAPAAALWLRGLESRLAGIGFVVGSSSLGV